MGSVKDLQVIETNPHRYGYRQVSSSPTVIAFLTGAKCLTTSKAKAPHSA
jgi:hypothetical protein